MEGNKIQDAEKVERVLDCVVGLHNLKILARRDKDFTIPKRLRAVEGEHIFKQETPVNLEIPDPLTPATQANVPHIFEFERFLQSAIGGINRALDGEKNDAVFFPTVLERGKNLFLGGYMLQIRLQNEGLDMWTISFIVGASYSYELHQGYVRMNHEQAVLESICDCISG